MPAVEDGSVVYESPFSAGDIRACEIALLSSMFTDKSYRRQGIAKKLLSLVVDEARKHGCGTVQITASDMGVLLYTDFGFVKNNNFMQYKL